MARSTKGRVLFVGSGPYRISQEIRGNIFAHSCLDYFHRKDIDFVVIDSDAAGVFARDVEPDRLICAPLDERSIEGTIERVKPRAVWALCAGKEVQGAIVRVLGRRQEGDLLPGDLGAYAAATDWAAFRAAAESSGVPVPFGGVASSMEQAARIAGEVGFPVFLSASMPTGGGGARIVYNREELTAQMVRLLSWSLTGEVLAVRVYERHVQFQVPLLRDASGNARILGIVEVLGPLGVHISNSPLVFPGTSLKGKLAACVEGYALKLADTTGLLGYGAFHFGMEPGGGAYAVGMRTSVGSSTYIASLGLGVDLGRAATAVAFGETVQEAVGTPLPTRHVVSSPRFDFGLFPGAANVLGPHKTSTGRGIGVGEGFTQAFLASQRAARTGETGLFEEVLDKASGPSTLPRIAGTRLGLLSEAITAVLQGHTIEEVSAAAGITRHFLEKMAGLVRIYRELKAGAQPAGPEADAALEAGFCRREVARATNATTEEVTGARKYPIESRGDPKGARLIICGPKALSVGGIDESDVILRETARALAGRGYTVVFAGWHSQMPLDLFFAAEEVRFGESAEALSDALAAGGASLVYVDPRSPERARLVETATAAGAALAGPGNDAVALLADRKALSRLCAEAGLMMKEGREVTSFQQAREAAGDYSYPVLVRPRGAGGDAVAFDEGQLEWIFQLLNAPAAVERFMEDIVECAAVVLCDGTEARTVAVVEVLEEAGISSVDCASVLPAFSIGRRTWEKLARKAEDFVAASGTKGIVTVRLGLRYDVGYFLSATAGGSREVPFASLALGSDIIGAAAAIFDGASLPQALPKMPAVPKRAYIRQPIFSFDRFPGADTVLGTQPRSNGDVIGTGDNFAQAFASARRAAGRPLPTGGTVFVSLRDRDKREGMLLGAGLKRAGFKVVATEGTARALAGAGIEARVVYRVSEGRPNVVDLIKNGEISMVVYTPAGRVPREDEVQIRTVAWGLGIPVITTIGEATAAVRAIEALKS